MNLFSDSWKDLKKHIALLFIVEFVFLFANFFLFVYVKSKVFEYLTLLKQYLPLIESVQQELANNPNEVTQLAALVQNLEPVADKMMLFLFVVVPLIVFITWCIAQGFIWGKITHIKLSKRYFAKFASGSVIGFLVISSFLSIFIKEKSFFEFFDARLLGLLGFIFVVYFFMTAFYNHLDEGTLSSTLRKVLIQNIKRIAKTFLPLFLLFVSSFLLFVLLSYLFVNVTLKETILLHSIPLVLLMCGMIGINLFLRIVVYNALHKR